jgi:hypothetical protein
LWRVPKLCSAQAPDCQTDGIASVWPPIVFVNVVDPVGSGFVDSLARPGGNTTGFYSTGLAVILALPLFWIMYHPSPVLALLGQTGFGVIFGLFSGTQSTMMIESTPSRIRCTAVGLGHNACVGVVGGLTPLVATWLVERTADELAPAYLI